MVSDDILEARLDISNVVLDDHGWVVLISPLGNRLQVEIQIGRRVFIVHYRRGLRSIDKFRTKQDGRNMHLMDIYLLSRKGSNSAINRSHAKDFDRGLVDFDSDIWTHYLPRSEWSMDQGSKRPVRGSMTKSEYFMLFLMSAFCPEGGIALDLLVGAGTPILAAKKAGVHLFGMDIDESCVSWVKENRGLDSHLQLL